MEILAPAGYKGVMGITVMDDGKMFIDLLPNGEEESAYKWTGGEWVEVTNPWETDTTYSFKVRIGIWKNLISAAKNTVKWCLCLTDRCIVSTTRLSCSVVRAAPRIVCWTRRVCSTAIRHQRYVASLLYGGRTAIPRIRNLRYEKNRRRRDRNYGM